MYLGFNITRYLSYAFVNKWFLPLHILARKQLKTFFIPTEVFVVKYINLRIIYIFLCLRHAMTNISPISTDCLHFYSPAYCTQKIIIIIITDSFKLKMSSSLCLFKNCMCVCLRFIVDGPLICQRLKEEQSATENVRIVSGSDSWLWWVYMPFPLIFYGN